MSNDTYSGTYSINVNGNIQNKEFIEALVILSQSRHSLTASEESTIKRIANKFKKIHEKN